MLQGQAWLESPDRRKRDLLYTAALLPVAVPSILAGLGLAHLIDGGSPLYRQNRLGRNGKPFTMYKIRSMPDSIPAGPGLGPNDPRATKLGRLLRLSGIDELPQLYNILRGDMSLFGLRAVMEPELDIMQEVLPESKFQDWYHAYTVAGPGCISTFGHASRSRNFNHTFPYSERVEMDLYDFENASELHDRQLLKQVGQTGLNILQDEVAALLER